MKLPNQLVRLIEADIWFKKIGILPVSYADTDNFNKMQDGYRFNGRTGESFISEKDGEWHDGWHVFAHNCMDEPFYIDFLESEIGFPVYYSYHGMGKWEPIQIADSLEQFHQILVAIKENENELSFDLQQLSLPIDLSNEFWKEVNDACACLEG